MSGARATVYVPGSIGNVGPGFDVLGLAFESPGDQVTVRLTDGAAEVESVTGRDAALVPLDPAKNVAAIAATAWLRAAGIGQRPIVSIKKGLPLAGGMGGSAASSVGGALAAARAAGASPSPREIMAAALEGEASASGRHLDNIVPSLLGGLGLVLSVDPIEAFSIPVTADWDVVLVRPHVRIETKAARAILPEQWDRRSWIQQMANTAALAHAFATGDGELLRHSLHDLYAEPLRAPLIPGFVEAKQAALATGALGCSISGSGPTIFAITAGGARECAAAMVAALSAECDVHITRIASQGAHQR